MWIGGARGLLREVHRHARSGSCGTRASRSPSSAPIRARQAQADVSRNLSRVSIVPKILPQTSFEACILRAILLVQSCGTWQSGQVARTPERLVKWIVPFSSSIDVVAHLVAAGAELLGVGGFQRGVEAAPEDHAGDEAAERQEGEAEVPAWPGRRCSRTRTATPSTAGSRSCAHRLCGARARCACLEACLARAAALGLRDVARGAEIAAGRDAGEYLAVTVQVMGNADHRRARPSVYWREWQAEAAIGVAA